MPGNSEWQSANIRRQHREEVTASMGPWLQDLAPWDVYCTLTWSRPVSVDGVLYGSRRYFTKVQKWAGAEVYAFLGVERGPNGGLLHAHGLMGNVGHLKTSCGKFLPSADWGKGCCLRHAWPWGYARVVSYDPKLGAAHYVSKYVAKELCEWELVGFPATPQLALRNSLYQGG